MPRVKLTALSIGKLARPEKGQIDYFDATMPAFGLRVSTTRRRTYFVMTRINGKLARLTLGQAKLRDDGVGLTLREARKKAGEMIDMAENGIDPRQLQAEAKQKKEEREQNTFRAVGDRFLRQYVAPRLKATTQRDYKRLFSGPDTRRWANKPVSEITRADVRRLLDKIIERGSPGTANNTFAYLRKFFNWCAEKDLVEVPPTDHLKPPAPKKVGERTLDEAEVAEVWRAFESLDPLFRDLFKLLLLTGQRRAEVSGMLATELTGLDTEAPMWEIPSSRTKNSRPHQVPLSPLAAEIVRNRPVIGAKAYLFSTTGKTPCSGFSKAKRQADQWIAEERQKRGTNPMPDWRLHDLRRTMVTMMNEHLGVSPHVVEACVNHISGVAKAGVAGVYNKALYMSERKAAFRAWSEFVEDLNSQ